MNIHPLADSGETSQSLACDAAALDPAVRAAHFAWIQTELPRLLVGFRELPDGYALDFAADAWESVATFVAHERRCCPFLAFALELASGGGPLHVRLTGPDGVKRFLAAELGLARP